MDGTVDDAATMAARNFTVSRVVGRENQVRVSAKDPGHLARVRTKTEMKVHGGDPGFNFQSSGEVATASRTLEARYDASLPIRQEKPIDPFYQLAWDQIKTANPAGKTVAAGVYVWWQADGQLLDGTLIAYGGNPKEAPGSNGRGTVIVRARDLGLKFDPSYLGGLSQSLPANFELKPLSWNTDLKP